MENRRRNDHHRVERLGDDRRQDDLGQLVGESVEHLRGSDSGVVGALDAIESVQREGHRFDPFVDVVDPPEVVQSRPAADHRHGVEAAIEPGVGDKLTILEERQCRVDLPAHGDPRRRIGPRRTRPTPDVPLETSMGTLCGSTIILGHRRIAQRHLCAAQLGEQTGDLRIGGRPQRRGARRHQPSCLDAGQQFAGSTVGDGNARPDLGQRVAVDGCMSPRFE